MSTMNILGIVAASLVGYVIGMVFGAYIMGRLGHSSFGNNCNAQGCDGAACFLGVVFWWISLLVLCVQSPILFARQHGYMRYKKVYALTERR